MKASHLTLVSGGISYILGVVSNKFVEYANNGKMPVKASANAIEASTHSILTSNTHYKILADIISIGKVRLSNGTIVNQMWSIGDALLLLGVMLLLSGMFLKIIELVNKYRNASNNFYLTKLQKKSH